MKNQKMIVIGDIHGKQIWKDVVEMHPDCKYIFLGDYCDPYDIIHEDDVIANLQSIINFKKQNITNVILLLGNHDIQYIYEEAEYCTRRMKKEEHNIRNLFITNILLFDWGYMQNNILFTHAGISQGWFRFSFPDKEENNILEFITNEEYKAFAFACGYARGGNFPYGGFFWASKSEMIEPLKGYVQIVGHNRIPEITVQRSNENSVVIFCDSLWNGKFLIIEDGIDKTDFFEADIVVGTKRNILIKDTRVRCQI